MGINLTLQPLICRLLPRSSPYFTSPILLKQIFNRLLSREILTDIRVPQINVSKTNLRCLSQSIRNSSRLKTRRSSSRASIRRNRSLRCLRSNLCSHNLRQLQTQTPTRSSRSAVVRGTVTSRSAWPFHPTISRAAPTPPSTLLPSSPAFSRS